MTRSTHHSTLLRSIYSQCGNRHRFGAMRMGCTQKPEGRVTMGLKYGGEVTPLFQSNDNAAHLQDLFTVIIVFPHHECVLQLYENVYFTLHHFQHSHYSKPSGFYIRTIPLYQLNVHRQFVLKYSSRIIYEHLVKVKILR